MALRARFTKKDPTTTATSFLNLKRANDSSSTINWRRMRSVYSNLPFDTARRNATLKLLLLFQAVLWCTIWYIHRWVHSIHSDAQQRFKFYRKSFSVTRCWAIHRIMWKNSFETNRFSRKSEDSKLDRLHGRHSFTISTASVIYRNEPNHFWVKLTSVSGEFLWCRFVYVNVP